MCITNNPDHFLIRADFLFEKKAGSRRMYELCSVFKITSLYSLISPRK
jgi:hypothetical protein